MTYQETLRRPTGPRSAARIPQFPQRGATAAPRNNVQRNNVQRNNAQRSNVQRGATAQGGAYRRDAYAGYDRDRRASAERAYYERRMREERRRAAAEAEERRRLEYLKALDREIKEEKKAAKKRERAEERAKTRAAEKERAAKEVKVARTKISFSFIAVLLVSSLMIMAVIFSYAQVSAVSRQISESKKTLDSLKAEEEELTFALEQKNDVRLIEKIATEKIGMVKEGAVAKRFISLSEGDSIELEVTEAPEGGSGAFGSVLSAIAGFFDNIRDYVR